jgi:phage recombination protein Bet
MDENKTTALLAPDAVTVGLPIQFGGKEVALIKQSKCPDSTPEEFNLFLYDSASRGLNPLKNEIYFVKRSVYNPKTGKSEGRASHQVGIDGFRIIAQKSGEYRGQTKVEYGAEVTYAGIKAPCWAEVGVMRKGFDTPVYAKAFFAEYVQSFKKDGVEKLGTMWQKMPYLMIAKCAEALALRKAFPDCLAGLYTNDEMSQAEPAEVKEVSTLKEKKVIVPKIEKEKAKKVVEEITNNLTNGGLAMPDTIAIFETMWEEVIGLYKYDEAKAAETRKKILGDKELEEMTDVEVKRFIKMLDARLKKEQEAKKEAEVPEGADF